MLDLTRIDVLLGIGFVAAIIAIAGGVRGVYSVSVSSRRERNNQATNSFPVTAGPSKRPGSGAPPDKRRKAA